VIAVAEPSIHELAKWTRRRIAPSIAHVSDWVTQLIRHARDEGLTRIDAKPSATKAWTDHVIETTTTLDVSMPAYQPTHATSCEVSISRMLAYNSVQVGCCNGAGIQQRLALGAAYTRHRSCVRAHTADPYRGERRASCRSGAKLVSFTIRPNVGARIVTVSGRCPATP